MAALAVLALAGLAAAYFLPAGPQPRDSPEALTAIEAADAAAERG